MRVENIRFLLEAAEDLDSGHGFYNTQSAGLGKYFVDTILGEIESLYLYAGIHRKEFGFFKLLSRRFPYAVYYDIEGDTAIVVAILDLRRNPAWIKSRLK